MSQGLSMEGRKLKRWIRHRRGSNSAKRPAGLGATRPLSMPNPPQNSAEDVPPPRPRRDKESA